MQRVNGHRFYELAVKHHPLVSLDRESTIQDSFILLWEARDAILQLFDQIPLRVCVAPANKIVGAIDSVIPRAWPDAFRLVSSEGKIGYAAYAIKEGAEELETVLAAELQSLDTYLISQKGSYSTPDLIERAEIMFPESIRRHLPKSAIADIRQAGRCLALDTPTACGFHILRAVEAVMAQYYAVVVGRTIPTRMRNWGIYIQTLRTAPKASSAIIEFLDHIRDEYRNPITHPDVMLELDEVEVLLGVAVASIRQMVLEIQRLKEEAAEQAIMLAQPQESSGPVLELGPP